MRPSLSRSSSHSLDNNDLRRHSLSFKTSPSPQRTSLRPSHPLSSSSSSRPESDSKLNRRKTFGGDLKLVAAAHGQVIDYEERIAFLEASNSQLSNELEATRVALKVTNRQEDQTAERQSSALSSAKSVEASDEHSDLMYERKLRMDILESFKKVRSQYSAVSLSLSEEKEKNASLTGLLDSEQASRQQLEKETERLSKLNFTLLEHNKLLAGRDAALQKDISNLLAKSQADDWMREVLQGELRLAKQGQTNPDAVGESAHISELPDISIEDSRPRPALGITVQDFGPMRAQLFSTRDELHIAKLLLADSEKKCEELTTQLSTLQAAVSSWVDSSSSFFEFLRVDVPNRTREMEKQIRSMDQLLRPRGSEVSSDEPRTETERRKTSWRSDESSLQSARISKVRFEPVQRMNESPRFSQAESNVNPTKTSQDPPISIIRSSSIDSSSTLVPNPSTPCTEENILPVDKDASSPTSHFKPFLASATAVKPPLSARSSRSFNSTTQKSINSDSSNTKTSALLATTLSKDRTGLYASLKTTSTLFVDASPSRSFSSAVRKKSRRNSKRLRMKRASGILADIAKSYQDPDGEWQVVS